MHSNTKLSITGNTANSGVTTIFNSTYGLDRTPSATVIGPYGGLYAGARCAGSLTPTGQTVTLRLDGLENGAWVTGISSTSVTATTTQPFDFLPRHPDWRVVIVNGATGPTTLVVEAYLVIGDRSSGT